MTYSEAVVRIRQLSRVTDLSVDTESLFAYYRQALDEIAEAVNGFYYEADISVSAPTGSDEPPALVTDTNLIEARRCWWKYDTEDKYHECREVSFFDLPESGTPGKPRQWAQYQDDIYIFPAPKSSGTLRVRGLSWRFNADESWTSDELQLPKSLHMAAVHRTVSFLCDTNDDFERSNRHLGLFNQAVERYRMQRDNENSDIGFGPTGSLKARYFRGAVN